MKHIIEKESKSSKKANDIEENIFKVGIKSYFLIDGGICKLDDFLEADRPWRQALEIMIRCHNHAKYSRNVNQELLREKLTEAVKNINEVVTILTKLLTGHMKPNNVARVNDVASYFADVDRMLKIFNDVSIENDLQELIEAADHYTQFHFYAEK